MTLSGKPKFYSWTIMIMTPFLLLTFHQNVYPVVWDWEDGTLQGWRWKNNFTATGDTVNLANSPEQAYHGSYSLLWSLQGSSQEQSYWYVFKSDPTIEAGGMATYYVWVPAGAPINGLKTYMRDSGGSWIDGTYYPYSGLQSNTWNEISIQIPADAAQPLTEIGLQVQASTDPVDFAIYLDYVTAGVPTPPQNLTARQQGLNSVILNWADNTETDLAYYRVYRDTLNGFSAGISTLLAEPDSSAFLDTGLELHHVYYYLATALDTSYNESLPSNQASVSINEPGSPPVVQVKSINTTSVPLYTKFEIILDLTEASYVNPYNPDDIDVRATFISPSGKQWDIYGFYDNYNNRNTWKVRFSPNEAGAWHYTVTATDADGTGQTDEQQFTAVSSEFHGPIHVSEENAHYLNYDDGTPFYGVGVYLPWGESVSRLNNLQNYDANIFAIWNIIYGNGLTNSNSIGIIENEIGRYNQLKCGRIDSLLRLAEDRNIVIQYAIWPHDLFSNTVWAHQWSINPYRLVCDVKDIYNSEEAWVYQEKQYRYLIARFGYSRSWGIWEIINEANGTDAWEVAHKYDETWQWVGRVHQYFQANDPYNHPTTASLSGGYYWTEGYQQVDMPCVHVYETSWSVPFAGDPLRSSMWIYHQVAQSFWNDFNKPGEYGEAGATDSYGGYQPGSIEYTTTYHNSIWASWSSGISMTPLWWDYSILRNADFEQLKAFSQVAPLVDYANEYTAPLIMTASSCDAFGIGNTHLMYGWIRDINGYSVSNKILAIQTTADTSWHFRWYNTWTGSLIIETYEASMNGYLEVDIPETGTIVPDMAYIAEVSEGGTIPFQLVMTAANDFLLTNSPDSVIIRCALKDSLGRFCGQAANPVFFQKTGPGVLRGQNPVNASGGVVYIIFKADSVVGLAQIVASSPGMDPDTVTIRVSNRIIIDDFEYYSSNTALNTNWKVRSGTTGELSLEKTIKFQGLQSMKYLYAIGDPNADYGTIIKSFKGDYSGTIGFDCWIRGDGSNRALQIRIRETTGRYGTYDVTLNSSDGQNLDLSYADFTMNNGGEFNPAKFMEIWFTIRAGSGTDGEGTVYFDNITLKVPGYDPTTVRQELLLPLTFRLDQNYPNPFNNSTTFRYSLAKSGRVKLAIYSIGGQKVAELINEPQNAGEHHFRWEAAGMSSGLYLYVLENGENRLVKKCILIK
jgi:hypothetical protein